MSEQYHYIYVLYKPDTRQIVDCCLTFGYARQLAKKLNATPRRKLIKHIIVNQEAYPVLPKYV